MSAFMNNPQMQNLVQQAQGLLQWLSSAAGRKTATLVLALLCVLAAALIVKVVIAPDIKIAALQVDANRSQPLRGNWFVRDNSQQATITKQEAELAVASIRAELLGVVLAGEDSVATISTPNNPDGVYRVGDEIQAGVELREIEATRVVVFQGGTRRQIPFKPLSPEKPKPGQERQSLIEVQQPRTSRGGSGGGFSLSGLVSTTPIQVPGRGVGLRLSGLTEDVTDLADIAEGDVVLAVNSTPVGDIITNPLLWQQFANENSLPLTLLRGEEELEVFVNAESLSQRILPTIGAGGVR